MRALSISRVLVGLGLAAVSGCGTKAADPDKADASKKTAASTTVERGDIGELGLSYSDEGRCVEVAARCVASVAELRDAAPELPSWAGEDPALTVALARALHWLETDNQAFVSDEASARAQLAEWIDPPDVFGRGLGIVDAGHSAPPLASLSPPRWTDEGTLEFDSLYNMVGAVATSSVIGYRNSASFGEAGWVVERRELESQPVVAEGVAGQIAAAFGGPAGGFFCAKLDGGEQVCVAVDAAAEAKPYLWVPVAGDHRNFARWAELTAAVPEARGSEVVARIATALDGFFALNEVRGDGYTVIEEPGAYAEQYRAENRGEHKLRVRHDDLEITLYTVSDWSAIGGPKIVDDRLVVFFRDQAFQPHRVDVDLRGLSLGRRLEFEPFFTKQRGGGPLGVEAR